MKLTDKKGFTLIEILIALGIGIVILGSVLSIYTSFVKTTASVDQKLEIQLELKGAGQRLVKELRAAGCYYRLTPIETATATQIMFESDLDPAADTGPWQIRYTYNAGTGLLSREQATWNADTSDYGALTAPQGLAGSLTDVTFTYFDESDTEIVAPIDSQANRDRIRKVVISLTAESGKVNPISGNPDTITTQTSVHMRCMGVEQSSDTTECVAPTGGTASDPGICGEIDLSWVKSTSLDAAGYRVYYKETGAGAYTGVFDVPGGSKSSATLTGLKEGQQYDIAMKCYDTAGNINANFSVDWPISGTVSPIDTKPDDDTAPALPTGADATATDGYVTVTWDAAPLSEDVGGYSIWRSDDGGTLYTEVGSVGSNLLAYTDQTPGNCPKVGSPAVETPYHYKVQSWDCAGNKNDISKQTAVYGDGAREIPGIVDHPSDTVTDTYPADTSDPPDPSGFTAIPGADKIYLSFTTPAYLLPEHSIEGTRILKRTGLENWPTDAEDIFATGVNGKKDNAPHISSQTYSLVDQHSDSNPTNPIEIGTTYNYKAFSYDSCRNYSPGTSSFATARPCGDGDPGSKHYGPPEAPSKLASSTCDYTTLTWPISAGSENGNRFEPLTESDVVGYNIYRSTSSGGPYTKLNDTPVTSTSYSDSTLSAGSTYYYTVRSEDCALNESTTVPATQEEMVIPNGIDWDPSVTVNISGSDGIPGSQQNIVKLGIKALGSTSITLDKATISWNNATASLKKVTLVPFATGYNNVIWDDTVMPLSPSGSTIDFEGFQGDAGLRRIAAGSTQNELILEFRDSVNDGYVDMRGAKIQFTIDYTADMDNAPCVASLFTVPVPSGPVITSTVQDRPNPATVANLTPGLLSVLAGTQDTSFNWTFDKVTVSSTILAETNTTIPDASTFLYYATTARAATTAPATDYSPAPDPLIWTPIEMCRTSDGSVTYETTNHGGCSSAPIPARLDGRVWYYIRSVDSNGNTDIEPEPTVRTTYTYDQPPIIETTLRTLRSGPSGREVRAEVYLQKDSITPITGATVKIDIQSTGLPTLFGAVMSEVAGSPGNYIYPATGSITGFKDKHIDVRTKASHFDFTTSQCGDINIHHTETNSSVTCD